jgi:hypothetical protein
MISAYILALVAGLAMLTPAPARGQSNGRLYVATDHGVYVPATDQQLVRVTIGNPVQPDPAGDRQLQSFVVQFDRPVDPVTIGPGESFTYTLDPREAGVLVDPSTGLRHVRVSGRITAVVVDPSDSAPQPALLIELLNRRTGKLESFHAFPGFSGGVFVGSGD